MVQNITEAQKAKFLSLFDKGIGLVVLHHALVSHQHWPDYERIIGGRYLEADGKSGVITTEVGYEHDVDIPVVLLSQDHPVTAGLNNFVIHDEIYWRSPKPGGPSTVHRWITRPAACHPRQHRAVLAIAGQGR